MLCQKPYIFSILKQRRRKNPRFCAKADGAVKIRADIFQCFFNISGPFFKLLYFILISVPYYGKSGFGIQCVLFCAEIGEMTKICQRMACACLVMLCDQSVFQFDGQPFLFLGKKLRELFFCGEVGLTFLEAAESGDGFMQKCKFSSLFRKGGKSCVHSGYKQGNDRKAFREGRICEKHFLPVQCFAVQSAIQDSGRPVALVVFHV